MENQMPAAEGRCTSRPGSSVVWTAPPLLCRNWRGKKVEMEWDYSAWVTISGPRAVLAASWSISHWWAEWIRHKSPADFQVSSQRFSPSWLTARLQNFGRGVKTNPISALTPSANVDLPTLFDASEHTWGAFSPLLDFLHFRCALTLFRLTGCVKNLQSPSHSLTLAQFHWLDYNFTPAGRSKMLEVNWGWLLCQLWQEKFRHLASQRE